MFSHWPISVTHLLSRVIGYQVLQLDFSARHIEINKLISHLISLTDLIFAFHYIKGTYRIDEEALLIKV